MAYDHRTEGEIHFNKRDFDLSDNRSDVYDDYAEENGDGTLEGAVYGLFAAQDIIHPDTDGDAQVRLTAIQALCLKRMISPQNLLFKIAPF